MTRNVLLSVLLAAGALTSCDFTEECEYHGWLRVENNWQGYNDIPAAPDRNYALFYSDTKGFQGEQAIVPNLIPYRSRCRWAGRRSSPTPVQMTSLR